jgi:hypothetical protein
MAVGSRRVWCHCQPRHSLCTSCMHIAETVAGMTSSSTCCCCFNARAALLCRSLQVAGSPLDSESRARPVQLTLLRQLRACGDASANWLGPVAAASAVRKGPNASVVQGKHLNEVSCRKAGGESGQDKAGACAHRVRLVALTLDLQPDIFLTGQCVHAQG